MQKSFNIKFKKVGTDAYKAFSPPKRDPELEPNWDECPQIENCSVSHFLAEFDFGLAEEKMLKVTIADLRAGALSGHNVIT